MEYIMSQDMGMLGPRLALFALRVAMQHYQYCLGESSIGFRRHLQGSLWRKDSTLLGVLRSTDGAIQVLGANRRVYIATLHKYKTTQMQE